ncbi:HD domain-containing protein, partial [Acinetobacter nosocomialis]
MVELLSTLSMDKDSMRAALLFPLAEEDLINQEVITEHFGEAIWNLVRGVMEMDAIRQLKATHTNETSSVQ